MKYLKTFEEYYGGGCGGSGGSGDVPIVLKDKTKGKKGDPSQVSDLRFLAKAKTNKVKDFKKTYKTL